MKLQLFQRWLFVCFAAAVAWLCASGPCSAYVILFKDGFIIKGQVGEHSTIIVDRAARKAFTVRMASTPYFLETPARRILFTPNQVHDVQEEKSAAIEKWMDIKVEPWPRRGDRLPEMWKYISIGKWNHRWQRPMRLQGPPPRNNINFEQRIVHLTPEYLRAAALGYLWFSFYRADELPPETLQQLLEFHFAKARNKNLSKYEKKLKTARFLARSGRTAYARNYLNKLLTEFPDKKSELNDELRRQDKILVLHFVDDLERAVKLGRQQEASARISRFFTEKMETLIDTADNSKFADRVYAIKLQYDKQRKQLKSARQHLNQLPKDVPVGEDVFFKQAANDILSELNVDTLPRLKTFVRQAYIYNLAKKQKRKPSFSAKQVLAFAMTGWLLGDGASKENVDQALQLWGSRNFLASYLKNLSVTDRDKKRNHFETTNKKSKYPLGLDVITRIIRRLPPVEPHKTINTEMQLIDVSLPDKVGRGQQYLLKLPPGYHHGRQFPVLIVLHDIAVPPKKILDDWSDLAAKHGYILAAPIWAQRFQTQYSYSEREHRIVINCVRDLRRRFQVDSDRVFLTGSEEGGMMAYDVGLAHPGLFAGVLPMAAWPDATAPLYWSNAQYLPFYVVDGEKHGDSFKKNEKLFKTWIRSRYPVFYVSYKGRGREWFGGELPTMIDWMNRKKRVFPLKQVGNGAALNAEHVFRTLRTTDNRFYWLTTNRIHPPYVWNGGKLLPNRATAKLSAKISTNNRIDLYSNKGVGQASIWLAPGMIDFSKKVTVFANGRRYLTRRVRPSLSILLEDLYRRGDRQQLFVQRIDLGK